MTAIPFTQPLTLHERDGQRDPDTRRWNVTDTNTETFQGAVEPATGDQLELLDPGERTGGEIVVQTKRELHTADEDSDPPEFADQITYEGDRYEVRNVRHWTQVIPHYEAVCVKV